jgi:hypothetical protein
VVKGLPGMGLSSGGATDLNHDRCTPLKSIGSLTSESGGIFGESANIPPKSTVRRSHTHVTDLTMARVTLHTRSDYGVPHVTHTQVNDITLACLSCTTSLKVLLLAHTHVTDVGIQHLAG